MASGIYTGFYSGMIVSVARSETPEGWLPCNGSLVSRSQYPELFDSIQHIYNGNVDPGGNNFRLPNLNGRYPRGATNAVPAGTYDGSANHNHTFNTGLQTNIASGQNAPVTGGDHSHNYNSTAVNLVASGDHNHTVTLSALTNAGAATAQARVGNTGTALPHNHSIGNTNADGAFPASPSNHGHGANIGGIAQSTGAHSHNASATNHSVTVSGSNEPLNNTVFYFIKI